MKLQNTFFYLLWRYLAAIITIVGGILHFFICRFTTAFSLGFAGHVITGVGFITACVATAATSSTRFSLIPANAKATGNEVPEGAAVATQAVINPTHRL